MKLALKIKCVFLIFALLTSCVAATENKDLPTKEEITDFIAGIPVSDNYIITVFNTVKDKQPAWNCDTWVDKNGNQILSLYYVDSAKGYGSIYFNKLGKEISKPGVGFKLENHYVGEAVSVGTTPVDPTPVDPTPVDPTAGSTEEQSVEEKRLDEIEERLAEYEGESQSVKYNSPPVEDDSQSVEDVAHTVENVSQTVEDVAHTVENVATKVEEEEETKRNNGIREGMFVTVVGGVIVLVIELFLKRKRGRGLNL